MKYLIVTLLLLGFNLSHSFVSRFLELSTNSPEYGLLMNPDSYSLKEGALLAAGVLPENMGPYLTQISNFEEQVKPLVSGKQPLDTAYVLFTEMHKKLLKKYEESSTTLDVVLKMGKYNCLSSTVLYCLLLEDFNIPWKVAVLPSHVFAILEINGAEIDIENTSPYGFYINTNKQGQQDFKKQTGFEYSADPSIREVTGKKGLYGYTYGNISFYEAMRTNTVSSFQNVLKSVAVNNDGKYIYTNAVSAYTTYIFYLFGVAKENEKALAVSEEALQYLPKKELFMSNYYTTLGVYLNSLIDQGKYDESFQTLARSKRMYGPNRLIDDALYSQLLYRLIVKEQDFNLAYDYAKTAVIDVAGSQNVKSLLKNGLDLMRQKLSKAWESYPNGELLFLKWYSLMSDDPNMRIIYENYYVEISTKCYQAGFVDKALDINRKALNNYTDSLVLKKNMVMISAGAADKFNEKKDYVNGLKYTKIAMIYEPKNQVILHNLGVIYDILINREIDKKNYNQALVLANEAIGYVPDNKKIQYDRDYLIRKLKKK